MDIKSIIQLMQAAQETDFDHIEMAEGDFAMKLERGRTGQLAYVPAPQAAPAGAQGQPAPITRAEPETTGTPGGKDIVSPLVGMFHALSGAKAVKIGGKLKKGDPVCMIEAMKLMNEINMPEDGEIVWVAANEGDTVEYGQLLFRYI
jgi:acetyl-CoA carboxylase biotin carboxyl carrier protein